MKVDVSVSRKMTINTGNYSSVSPSVTVTAKDVPAKNSQEIYWQLSRMVDNMMCFEIRDLFAAQEGVQDVGWKKYIEHINSVGDDIQADIEDAQHKLEALSGEDSPS